MIDLHCHSHFSDGALSPEVLFQKALNANLQMIALTDHDTVAGLAALHRAAEGSSMRIINGIELSTRWKKHDIHILGLNVRPNDELLTELIEEQNVNRIKRAVEISARLEKHGIKNAYEKACLLAGHARAARPHFAQVLVNEQITSDLQSAFKRFLGRGKTAYVPTPWLIVERAVEGIMHAGGDAVIAHPYKYALTRSKLHELIETFKTAGGAGLEVVSGETPLLKIHELVGMCSRFGLFASTGSDFHGDGISRIGLGRQHGLPNTCKPIWEQWIN